MNDDISQYLGFIEEEYKRFGLNFDPTKIGITLNKVQFNRENKSFSYTCIAIDENIKQLFNNISVEDLRFEYLFPQQTESKFDWSVVMGHASEFYSISFFYCYSAILSRWFRCMMISPKKSTVIISFEDITQEKNQEIETNILRYQH